ncbi:MAG TPA: hypothetical protein ENJ18_02675 [Nannocystis exedens]|nr:hypothetical protein [Nannocystis exedens]
MEPVLKPKPWWQRAWFFVGAPALAGGAALLLVLGTPMQNSGLGDAAVGDPKIAVADGARPTLKREAPVPVPLAAKPTGSVAESNRGPASAGAADGSGSGSGSVSVSASALVLEQHFSLLERGARRELAGRIDLGRARARGDLLARAQGTRS